MGEIGFLHAIIGHLNLGGELARRIEIFFVTL